MPWFEESKFRFNLPSGRYFRFEDCDTYVSLAGASVREMDFGWIEGDDDTQVFLLEVKYFIAEGATTFDLDRELDRICEKVTDALTMLTAVWLGTDHGRELLDDIRDTCPDFPTTMTTIRPVLAIGLDRPDASMLLEPLRTQLRTRLRGLCRLLGIPQIAFLALDEDFSTDNPISIRPANGTG